MDTAAESNFFRPFLERPLFEELTEDHYREDAYGGPYGLLLGGTGMGQLNKGEVAAQYLDAANHLVELIKEQRVEDFTLTNPILFLFRHSIELLLKSRLEAPPRTHNLSSLKEEFSNRLKSKYNEDLPSWINDRIVELSQSDPYSTEFRYADSDTIPHPSTVAGDEQPYVDLLHLQKVLRAIHAAFVNVPEGI